MEHNLKFGGDDQHILVGILTLQKYLVFTCVSGLTNSPWKEKPEGMTTLEDSVKIQLWAGSDDSGTKMILTFRYNKCNILEQTL